jgi:hypothetical protein
MDKIKRYYDVAKECVYVPPIAFTTEQQVVDDALYHTFNIQSCECALFIIMKWIPLVQSLVKNQLKMYIRTYGTIEIINMLDAKTL